MIIVNVEIPMLGKKMDFRVDEEMTVEEISSALAETIHASGEARVRDEETFFLWDKSGRLLEPGRTGRENGLASGSSLVFA